METGVGLIKGAEVRAEDHRKVDFLEHLGRRRFPFERLLVERRQQERPVRVVERGRLVEIPTERSIEQIHNELARHDLVVRLRQRLGKRLVQATRHVERIGTCRRRVFTLIQTNRKLAVELATHQVLKNLRNKEQAFITNRLREDSFKDTRHN